LLLPILHHILATISLIIMSLYVTNKEKYIQKRYITLHSPVEDGSVWGRT